MLPPSYSFPTGPGQVLTFSSVSGAVTFTDPNNPLPFTGADGYGYVPAAPYLPTEINSYNGISGITNANADFLVGVFLDSNVPANSAPPALDFKPSGLTTSFPSLSPLIGQTFFIGDGLTGTGSGAVQQFVVPPTATRLFLGFADGYNVQGDPSWYGDNHGFLTVTFQIGGTLICATNKIVQCGANWDFDPPTVMNDCSGATNLIPTVLTTITNGICPQEITRTWQVVDACGNTNICSQTVTVEDTTAPVLTCAPDKTVVCGTTWDFDPPTAVDNCSGTNMTIAVTSTVTNAIPVACQTTITRTWQATDACGNTATCSQTVTVIDTTPPEFTCATNKTVLCGTAWTFDAPIASDACSGTNVTVVIASTVTNVTAVACQTAITRTWQATDACGNTATCSQTVTVVDTTPPEFTCATNKTVKCDQAWTFDTPTASDACSGTNVTVTILNTVTNGLCPQTITCTWLATDACGNASTCSQSVTLVDTVPPVLLCPANITSYTCSNSPGLLTAWATDACSPMLSTNYSPSSGTLFSAGTTTPVTVTATDGCGNTSTCTFNVTVLDQAITQNLMRGLPDCYSPWFSDSVAVRSACLTTAYGPLFWKSFDVSTVNRRFGLSWQGLPSGISAAQIFTRMKPRKTLFSFPENDTISFGLSGCNSSGWLWSQQIGVLPGGGPIWRNQAGCGVSFSFNLQSMPNLLSHMNSPTHRLDMLVQNDTTVDYAWLRIRYCPPQIFNGHPVYLTNAVAVVAPTGWVIAQDPSLTAATNVTAVFALGDTRDARLSLDLATLVESANRSLVVNFSSNGEDGVAERYGFRLESYQSPDGPGVAWEPRVSTNASNPRVRLLSGGQEVGGGAGLRPIQVLSGALGVEIAFTGGTNATARFAAPVLVSPGAGAPPVLADTIELTFEGNALMDAVATEIELISANLPEFGVRGIASGPGGNYESVQGNVLAQYSGGQLVLSPLDENSDQPISVRSSVTPTNEFRAMLGEPFGVFEPPATNSSLVLVTRGLVAGQERDLPSLHFDYTGSGWKLTARRDGAALLLGRVQVWNNGVLLADLTNAPSVQLSSLPPVHWPTLVRTTDDDISYRFPYPSGLDVLAIGVAYSGT